MATSGRANIDRLADRGGSKTRLASVADGQNVSAAIGAAHADHPKMIITGTSSGLAGFAKQAVEQQRRNRDGSMTKYLAMPRDPAWYWRNIEADPKVAQSVRKYCRFLLNPTNSQKYGVKELVRTTGFVGLTLAELLEPGSTF